MQLMFLLITPMCFDRDRSHRRNQDGAHAFLVCPNPEISKPIRFCVGTGASRTMIAGRDAVRLGLDYTQLQRSDPALSIGYAVLLTLWGLRVSPRGLLTSGAFLRWHELARIKSLCVSWDLMFLAVGENEAVVSCILAVHAGCECCCCVHGNSPFAFTESLACEGECWDLLLCVVWRCWVRLEGAKVCWLSRFDFR